MRNHPFILYYYCVTNLASYWHKYGIITSIFYQYLGNDMENITV